MNFLRADSKLMQFMSKVADIMIINLLFLLFSMPIITIGAAMTASHKVTQNMIFGTEEKIVKSFLRSFRGNFKQATIMWLLTIVCICILLYDALLVYWHCQGALATTLYAMLGFIALLVFCVINTVYPLIARYNNSLKQHIKNACYLSVWKIHISIVITLIGIIPIVVPVVYTTFFVKRIYLWVLLLFGLVFYLTNKMLKTVFLQTEEITCCKQ